MVYYFERNDQGEVDDGIVVVFAVVVETVQVGGKIVDWNFDVPSSLKLEGFAVVIYGHQRLRRHYQDHQVLHHHPFLALVATGANIDSDVHPVSAAAQGEAEVVSGIDRA